MVMLGIIGGSGLDSPDLVQDGEKIAVETPYGTPSSRITRGRINGVEAALLARHGTRHQFPPSQVNYRANIHALKQAGATHIVATTACGSLREEIDRGHFVIPDQFIDFTRHRQITFFDSFEEGAKHTPMADPFDEYLRKLLIEASREAGLPTHDKGTVITIEGPRFSTRAESRMFRSWGGDIINMSIAPEAVLANEAEIPYAAVAMSTDYDCWKTDEQPVTWDEIVEVFRKNAENMLKVLAAVAGKMAG
ncbi:MAG: S-methyl-5'-thioadenosine phosphorylase [Deltaproteobacteria bacterium]|nr:S-methyl-5'-thioadenosine phosphorylase [Deltaproteobacteria bacterium]